MEDYYLKYAKPVQNINIIEVKKSIGLWRNNLREELEGLVYLKSNFVSDKGGKQSLS